MRAFLTAPGLFLIWISHKYGSHAGLNKAGFIVVLADISTPVSFKGKGKGILMGGKA